MITTRSLFYYQHCYIDFDNIIFIINNHEILIDEFISIRLRFTYSYCEITHIAFRNNYILITINYNNQSHKIEPFTPDELLSLLDDSIDVQDSCIFIDPIIEWIKIYPINNSVKFGDYDSENYNYFDDED